MLDVRKIRLILELRESGISNADVLSAIEKIPREKFISEAYRNQAYENIACLLYTSPSPRDRTRSRMPSSA